MQTMVRILFVLFTIFLINTCTNYRYQYFIESKNLMKQSLPEEYKRTGMLSSSTYQIFLKIKADSFEEALTIAKKEIFEVAYYYITLEPFMFRYISPYGKQQILDLIRSKGKIIAIQKNFQENVYDVVFHVFEYDLRDYLKKIR